MWYVPIIVFGGYNAGTGWYGLAVVTINIICLCFVLAWLRLKSGSLRTCVILHASSNHFIQQFFDPMTARTLTARNTFSESSASDSLLWQLW